MYRLFHYLAFFILLLPAISLQAQYPPAAGLAGSAAIHKDSAVFVAWAKHCEVVRGPVNIHHPDGEKATFGDPNEAVGPAQGNSVNVVSLGDGGMATLTFDDPIANGDGWDFAVFENALNDTFLELAFVEVSSDGVLFVRFPAVSLTDPSAQVATFGEVDCTKINNLAGKYRQGYGTPFDLAELDGTPGLDINRITHVKIIDVVGCVDPEFATFDSTGNIINDPWPTLFDSGGFDLDGVGVINSSGARVSDPNNSFSVFPNPFESRFMVSFTNPETNIVQVLNVSGEVIYRKTIIGNACIDIGHQPAGFYFLKIESDTGNRSLKMIKTK
jgi:hypothetical protein